MKKTFFYIFRNNLTSQITTYFTRNQYFCTTVRVRTTQKYFNMPPKNDHWTKGERPPKGLSGRELGMYYRQKQLEKRRQQNFELEMMRRKHIINTNKDIIKVRCTS